MTLLKEYIKCKIFTKELISRDSKTSVLLSTTTSTSLGTSALGTTWSKRNLSGKTCPLERPESLP